jgi:hypothetical protein
MDLPGDVQTNWRRYLDLERRGRLCGGVNINDEIVSRVEALDPSARLVWARNLLTCKLDLHEVIVFGTPLFERVLFPALMEWYAHGDPNAAKWLAQLSEKVLSSRGCWEAMGGPGEVDLWEEAYRRNPNDDDIRQSLVKAIASYIRYTLHELPICVLCRNGWPSEEQCELLQGELEHFRGLLRGHESDDFGDLIEEAAFHYRAFRAYLREIGLYKDYAGFIAAKEAG